MQFGVGHSSNDLDPTERVSRASGREAAAILCEDHLEAQQQPGEKLPRDAPIVGAGLAAVALRRREGERSVAPHVGGELLLTVGDVREHSLAPAAEHLLGSTVRVERTDVIGRGAVLDPPITGAGLKLHVPATAAARAQVRVCSAK